MQKELWMLENQFLFASTNPVGPFHTKEEAESYAVDHFPGRGIGWLAIPVPSTPSE